MLALIENGKIPFRSWIIIENADRMSREGAIRSLQLLTKILEKCHCVLVSDASKIQIFKHGSKSDLSNLFNFILESERGFSESANKSNRLSEAWESKKKAIIEESQNNNTLKQILTRQIPTYLKIVNEEKLLAAKQLEASL